MIKFASFLEAAGHPDSAQLNAPFLAAFQERTGQVTRLHQQPDPDDRFPDMAVFPLGRNAGIGAAQLSRHSFEDGNLSLTAFYRRPVAPRFTERDARLLQGHGRKQIAAQLQITANTLAGCVKELYRHYDVHSHAELMRQFKYGDGGDR